MSEPISGSAAAGVGVHWCGCIQGNRRAGRERAGSGRRVLRIDLATLLFHLERHDVGRAAYPAGNLTMWYITESSLLSIKR